METIRPSSRLAARLNLQPLKPRKYRPPLFVCLPRLVSVPDRGGTLSLSLRCLFSVSVFVISLCLFPCLCPSLQLSWFVLTSLYEVKIQSLSLSLSLSLSSPHRLCLILSLTGSISLSLTGCLTLSPALSHTQSLLPVLSHTQSLLPALSHTQSLLPARSHTQSLLPARSHTQSLLPARSQTRTSDKETELSPNGPTSVFPTQSAVPNYILTMHH